MVSIFIVNPGSGAVSPAGEGWTNTREGAVRRATEWMDRMRAEGLAVDVGVSSGADIGEGRWRFEFRHSVTGVVVCLDTHGIDDLKAYEKERLFAPRVYWNGSSCSEPQLSDWAAPGFEPVQTFRAEAEQ